MNDRLASFIAKNNHNVFLAGMLTLSCPQAVIRLFLAQNRQQKLPWGEEKGCLTLSFDCDYPADVEAIPGVLKTMKKYSITSSFACVGYWIQKYPHRHEKILDYGHEIVNHTYSHPDNEMLNPGRKFKTISRSEKKEEIERCHEACKKVLNYEPVGCRIPHFKNLFTPDIYGILKEIGYVYSSSTWLTNTMSGGLPFRTLGGIVEFPLTTCPRHPFTVFDTWHSFNSPRLIHKLAHRTERDYIRLFKMLIEMGIEYNAYINVYMDPADILGMNGFEEILEYLAGRREKLLIVRYNDMMNMMGFANG